MNNREWLRHMEQRRRGEALERMLLTGIVALGVLFGGYLIASSIAGAFEKAAAQLEAAAHPGDRP